MNYLKRTALTGTATLLMASTVLAVYLGHYYFAGSSLVAGTAMLAYYHQRQMKYEGISDEDMVQAQEDILDGAMTMYETVREDALNDAANETDGDSDKRRGYQ